MRKRKIDPEETECANCKKSFKNNKSLVAHGSPEKCAKRIEKSWGIFKCQNTQCGKTYSKYVGPNRNKKGQKFCSVKCSSQSRELEILSLICKNDKCEKTFQTKDPNRKYCNIVCWNSVTGIKIKDPSKMGGPRDGGGFSKLFSYINRFNEEMKLNREEIEVAKFLDSTKYTWTRNWTGFKYLDTKGNERKFYPDFYIKEINLYLEYKGWVTFEMDHKMNDAKDKNTNLNLLIVVGKDKRFLKYGIPLDDLLNKKYII